MVAGQAALEDQGALAPASAVEGLEVEVHGALVVVPPLGCQVLPLGCQVQHLACQAQRLACRAGTVVLELRLGHRPTNPLCNLSLLLAKLAAHRWPRKLPVLRRLLQVPGRPTTNSTTSSGSAWRVASISEGTCGEA